MRAILDTHVLLWWLTDSDRLSERSRELMLDPESELYWSAASSWEIAIKVGIGRLTLPEPPRIFVPRVLREQAIRPLGISHAHTLAVTDLPLHHRDPFDRLLVAQCALENMAAVSADDVFDRYGTERVW